MQESRQIATNLEIEALKAIDSATNKSEIEEIQVRFLGKQSQLTELFKLLGKASPNERKDIGNFLNEVKTRISEKISEKIKFFKNIELKAQFEKQRVDVTLPVSSLPINEGRIHPLTQVINEVISFFSNYGFKTATGPEIESDYYNFEALNFTKDHPARRMHDTFFIDNKDAIENPKLLRTHTSPVQIRSMLCTKPPLRVIIPGKTYRVDDDATHTPMFHQLEGLLIDKTANIPQLKWIVEEFCKSFFNNPKLKMRFRPSYFPFTQPSMEVDINYCYQNGELKIGEGDKWLEILGCGMVHPNVLKAGKIPDEYYGFAWGVGIERLAMLKYGINDLRAFFGSDINWFKHYGFKSFAVLEALNNNSL